MWNQSKHKNVYINEPEKSVRLGRFIGPIILYYVISLLAQVLWGVWALPKVLLAYIQGNEDVSSLMPDGYESLGFLDQLSEFMFHIDENGYFDFLYELTANALENIALITVLSALLSIPLFLRLMKKDRDKNRVYIFNNELKWKNTRYGLIALGSVVLCIALNSIINLSNLAEFSETYEDTSEALYSISLPLQIIGLGIIVPIFEELLYRGIIYNRMKVSLSKVSAIIVSAAIFGTMHGNLVQMSYALLLGIVFAWLYEVYKSIWAPILGHICMNLMSVILTQMEAFEWMFEQPLRVGVITVFCATASAAIYVMISNLISQDL